MRLASAAFQYIVRAGRDHRPVRRFNNLDELAGAVGNRLGHSQWLCVDQAMVDTFAAATGDHQWIHVDPQRAAHGPFGAPIVHGYLLLGLVPRMLRDVFEVDGVALMVNTGVDVLRFSSPVTVGTRVRVDADLAAVAWRARGSLDVVLGIGIEAEGRPGTVCGARVGLIFRPVRLRRNGYALTAPTDTANAGS